MPFNGRRQLIAARESPAYIGSSSFITAHKWAKREGGGDHLVSKASEEPVFPFLYGRISLDRLNMGPDGNHRLIYDSKLVDATFSAFIDTPPLTEPEMLASFNECYNSIGALQRALAGSRECKNALFNDATGRNMKVSQKMFSLVSFLPASHMLKLLTFASNS